MGLMARRKALLASGKKVIDTTIKILAENSRWVIGGRVDALQGVSASIIYTYEPQSVGRPLVYDYLVFQLIIFENGAYKDFWTTRSSDTRNVINANSTGIAVSVESDHIDDAYAYLPDGQILFAGKNTPYYGHMNISELS